MKYLLLLLLVFIIGCDDGYIDQKFMNNGGSSAIIGG